MQNSWTMSIKQPTTIFAEINFKMADWRQCLVCLIIAEILHDS